MGRIARRQLLYLCLALGVTNACSGARDGVDAGGEPDAPHSAGVAVLTPEQAAAAQLTYAVAARRSTAGGLTATAEIEAAPGRLARVGSRVEGRVTRVVAAEGDRVKAGAVLAWVDAPELAQATAEYLAANAEVRVAREIADRERELFERRISSEREARQAEAEAVRAEASKEAAEGRLHALGLSDSELAALQVVGHYNSLVAIRTPIAGTVARRVADVGQVVQPGEPLYEVVDLREVRLVVDVYDEALALVRAGQQAEVRTTATGDRVFAGRIASVGAIVERETRTVKLQVRLPNPEGLLRPGMFATVRLAGIPAPGDSGVTVIPETAVQRDGDSTIVFVPGGAGRFVRRVVKLGAPADSGWVTVTSGISPGDSIVATGAFVLKSELRRDELGEGEE